jgi:hypothetical protein
MKKSENMPEIASATWFWLSISAQFLKVGKKHGKTHYLPKKSVINMISLLLPVFEWPISWFAISSLSPICTVQYQF